MNLYLCTFIDCDGYSTAKIVISESTEKVAEEMESYTDEWSYVEVEPIQVAGYDINISINPNGVEELETDGWHIKRGQVYSSPYQPTHLRVNKIVMSESGDVEDATVYGTWVHSRDYSKEELNYETEEFVASFRVWHFNNEFSLEKDVD